MMVFIYIAASYIIPIKNEFIVEEDGTASYYSNNSSFLGISLIVLGIILIIYTFLPVYFPALLINLRYYLNRIIKFWPVLLIVMGIYLLIDQNKNKNI